MERILVQGVKLKGNQKKMFGFQHRYKLVLSFVFSQVKLLVCLTDSGQLCLNKNQDNNQCSMTLCFQFKTNLFSCCCCCWWWWKTRFRWHTRKGVRVKSELFQVPNVSVFVLAVIHPSRINPTFFVMCVCFSKETRTYQTSNQTSNMKRKRKKKGFCFCFSVFYLVQLFRGSRQRPSGRLMMFSLNVCLSMEMRMKEVTTVNESNAEDVFWLYPETKPTQPHGCHLNRLI